MSSINVGLGYNNTVKLTCKLLHKLCLLNLFILQDQRGEVCIRLCPPDLRLGMGGSSEPPEPPQPTGLAKKVKKQEEEESKKGRTFSEKQKLYYGTG